MLANGEFMRPQVQPAPHPQAAPRRLHVLLAAPRPLERVGIRSLLGASDTVGEVTDAPTATDVAAFLRRRVPSIAVVDLDPGDEDPVGIVRVVRDQSMARRVPVVAIGEREDERLVRGLVEMGVRGFLLKERLATDLAAAVELIAAGGAVLPPMATRWLIDWHAGCLASSSPPPPGLPHLTPRELDVLCLVAEGMSNAQIAQALVVGVSTVKSHLYHVMKKLGIGDRAKAVALAYQCGLVKPSSKVRWINEAGRVRDAYPCVPRIAS